MSPSDRQIEEWYAQAARLAQRGRGMVEPNPRVGALALQGEEVVGLGWHARFGGPHAEEVALEDARAAGREVDGLLVTLEPCSSEPGSPDAREKRRPACTSLILEAGLSRVYVGTLDPDPRHAGRGLRILREAGVQVEGPYEAPALEGLLDRFHHSLSLTRPWIQAKWAMTLDGRTASRTGSSRWISGQEALVHAHELRAAADAVMVGMGTVLMDDPALDVRHCEGRDPIVVVLDPRAEIPMTCKLMERAGSAAVWLLVGENCPQERVQVLEQRGLRLFPTRETAQGLDLHRAFETLRREGVRRLLVEGGGRLVGRLFEAGLLDQCEAILAPKLIGGQDAPGPIAGMGIASMLEAIRLEDVYTEMLGDCLLFGGYPRFSDLHG